MYLFPLRRAAATVLVAAATLCSAAQPPTIKPLDQASLREYAGAYMWGPGAYLYLQLWSELSGTPQLSHSMSPERCVHSTSQVTTVSLRAPVPPSQLRSNPRSSLSVIQKVRLSRSHGNVPDPHHGSRGECRWRLVRMFGFPMAMFA
jgi:hypothetical protein